MVRGGNPVESQNKSGRRIAKRAIRLISRLLIVAGAALLIFYAVVTIHSLVMSRMALRQFSEEQQSKREQRPPQSSTPTKSAATTPNMKQRIDFKLWAASRIAAYKRSLARQIGPPEAVLKIPKIGLEVPVFDGTDKLTLNRGVGRIIGTARLGQGGNLGIAGHRDGFFRGLKDLVFGDTIELVTTDREETYRVDQIRIVKPNNVEVLKDRHAPTLTLVTCYPFYGIGNAPLRYIVRASLTEESPGVKPGSGRNSTTEKVRFKEGGR